MSKNRAPGVSPAAASEAVLLVHGIGAKGFAMKPLRYRLGKYGFRVDVWRYRSLAESIEEHAERLHEHLVRLAAEESKVHVVAHSLGCVVTRAALALEPVANFGRLVLLAPPNCGTPVARFVGKWTRGFFPSINGVSDAPDSFVRRLPSVESIEVGIIAARFDLLIPVDNTHLRGEREHRVVNATHASLLLSKKAARLAASFLASGRFDPPG